MKTVYCTIQASELRNVTILDIEFFKEFCLYAVLSGLACVPLEGNL